jgi:hypothetical protein
MATTPWYCTREEVLAAGDVRASAWRHPQVDRLAAAAARSVDEQMRRVFYPVQATRRFSWPIGASARPALVWLLDDELISATSVTVDGAPISGDVYALQPANGGPPYSRIEVDRADGGDIAITGLFGYRDDHVPAGVLAEAVDDAETFVDVTDSAAVGVGSLIRVDTERMIVTGKRLLSTGQTLQGPLTATESAQAVSVTNGALFAPDEILLVDAERLRVLDVAGNTLIVRRAVDGSTLAAHTGSTIYAPRTLIVERGALGSTAAEHDTAAAIERHAVPSLINQLAVAETLVALAQETTNYARKIGQGEAQRDAAGLLADLRDRAFAAYARKVV